MRNQLFNSLVAHPVGWGSERKLPLSGNMLFVSPAAGGVQNRPAPIGEEFPLSGDILRVHRLVGKIVQASGTSLIGYETTRL